MSIFTRKQKKPQPIIEQQPEPVEDDQPFTAVEPARQVQPELMQFCANCKVIGATHQFVNGDLYLGRLEHNYLCDTCHEQREARRTRHNVANKSTVLEHPAMPARPRKKALVAMNGGVVNIGLAGKDSGPEYVLPVRTPSRPLEDRAVNLALEA